MRNVLFDFDGTLMNTWPGIEATLKASLKALDISVPDAVVTRALVGIPQTSANPIPAKHCNPRPGGDPPYECF